MISCLREMRDGSGGDDQRVAMNLPWDEAMQKVYMLTAHIRQADSFLVEGMGKCTSASQSLSHFPKKEEFVCSKCRATTMHVIPTRHEVLLRLKNKGDARIQVSF